MPVTLNEPLSTLQRLCEELEYSDLLDKAVTASRQALAAGAAAGDVSIVKSTNSVAVLSPVFVGEKKRGRNAFEDMEVPGFVTTE